MLDHKNIGTLVFFASRREMETFGNPGIRTGSVFIRDLQEEIRSRFHLKEHVSLDRVSLVTRFSITEETICSAHFSYSLPEKYRYLIKPHKAIGDAARIFLLTGNFTNIRNSSGNDSRGTLRSTSEENDPKILHRMVKTSVSDHKLCESLIPVL